MNSVTFKILSSFASNNAASSSRLRSSRWIRSVLAPIDASTTSASSMTKIYLSTASKEEHDRVVILGSGWAGFNTALGMKRSVPLTVVSPKNHFLFTPLLASSAVGTLEFRCIQENVRTILSENGKYIQAEATALDPDTKRLSCRTEFGHIFELEYDKLVISVGVQTNVSIARCVNENKKCILSNVENWFEGIIFILM